MSRLLLSTSSLQLSKQFPTGPTIQDVLTVLHDPQQTLQLSAYVLSATPDSARGDNNFLVTKTIPLFGGLINGSSTYKVKWAIAPDGADVEVDAGLGTTVKNVMRVKDDGTGVVLFTEDVMIKSPIILMSFIKSQLHTTHAEFHEKLIERVVANRTKEHVVGSDNHDVFND